VAHGGHDCGLGAYAGLGHATAAACEPIILPGVRSGLLLGIKGIHATQEEHTPSADSRQGQGECDRCSGESYASRTREPRDAEAGCTARSEAGGRSACSEPGGEPEHAICSVVGDGAHESGFERAGLGGCTSA
jgi:hypothetical protein